MEAPATTHGNIISLAARAQAASDKRAAALAPLGFNMEGTSPGADLGTEIELLREYLAIAASRLADKAAKGCADANAAAFLLRCARKAKVIGEQVEKLERKLAKAKRKAKRR